MSLSLHPADSEDLHTGTWREAQPGQTPGQVEPDDAPARDIDALRAWRLRTEAERQVEIVARAAPCPNCDVPAGTDCITLWRQNRTLAGSPHLGRVIAAGALHYLPLVEAWVKGELK